jgi:mannonate dehydratase
MNRRKLMKLAVAGPLLASVAKREGRAQAQVAQATRGMRTPKIQDIKAVYTAPGKVPLAVVKVTTDQDGLYGWGCASFTLRAQLVAMAVEKYLKPLLIGKPADRIEDIWQASYASSYWRNGPVLNNAISGVDQALWDIKGRQAGMPVYQLLGGKAREAAACYSHAQGSEIGETITRAKELIERGFRYVRVQVSVPGMEAYGSQTQVGSLTAKPLHSGPVYEPAPYIRRSLQLFEECRKQLGDEIELLHDVHERVTPNEAVQFAKDAERFKLFFLEDALSPEDIAYFRQIRTQCATPIAMGELFNSPHEWTPLLSERLIDYMRMHVSQMGGLSPARKVAAMGEIFGVKTAWHGPGDVSPIGHAANVALDLACSNFGIQEYTPFDEQTREVFQGTLVAKDGYLYANEAPGWGIEVNEKLAARFVMNELKPDGTPYYGFPTIRRLDGTVIKP